MAWFSVVEYRVKYSGDSGGVLPLVSLGWAAAAL